VQERAGDTVELISIGNDFLNRSQMAQQLRERINKWDNMKLKSFCTTGKKKVSELKRQHTEWEKIFARYTSDKYREFKKLNFSKINDPMKKMGK
jgi:hypothetical protein